MNVLEKAGNRLRQRDGLPAAIVESSSEAIISMDLRGCITSWNHAAERLLGYAPAEMIGEQITVLIPPERHPGEAEIRQRIKHREQVEEHETVRRRKDGALIEVSITASPINNASGGLVGISEMVHQATATQAAKVERRVAERTAPLEEINRSLESLSYSMAHDLRAPLRAIKGLSEALLQDYGPVLDETGTGYVRRIASSAERAQALITDLLAYSRINQAELPVHPVNVEAVLNNVLESLREEIYSKEAKIEIYKPLPPMLANTITLGQVAENIISNALKYVHKDAPPRLKIFAEPRGPMVRLNFKDSGIGIDAKNHERIFQLFERLDHSREYPGTGVGLAIVQRGIERLGGKVGVESEPGKGSCFWLELPRVN